MAKPLNDRRQFDFHAAAAKAWWAVAWACSLLPAAGGCRAVDHAQVDVLERDLRQQEDYIFELEDYLMQYSEKLRQCRTCQTAPAATSTTARKRRETLPEPTLADDAPEAASPPRSDRAPLGRPVEGSATPSNPDPALNAPDAAAPSDAAPSSAPEAVPVDPEDVETPGLEIGPTSDLKWKNAAPIATAPAGDEAPPFIPDPANYQADVELPGPDEAVDNDDHVAAEFDDQSAAQAPDEIEHETANAAPAAVPEAPALAGAPPELPPPADESRLTPQKLKIRQVFREPPSEDPTSPGSLLVVVEALNATDEPVDANGAVSVMVSVGTTRETLKPVDRWDFTVEETADSWQSSNLGDGLHLELPLGDKPLPEGPLELWARVDDGNGGILLTRVTFDAEKLTSLDAAQGDPQPPLSKSAAEDDPSEPAVAALPLRPSKAAAVGSTTESPKTTWRASNELIPADQGRGSTSSNGGQPASWTSQLPGRAAANRVDPRADQRAPAAPRWQQSSGVNPLRNGAADAGWGSLR